MLRGDTWYPYARSLAVKDQYLARLRKIEGQVRGLQRMIDGAIGTVGRLLRS